jgi:hypothetical protein
VKLKSRELKEVHCSVTVVYNVLDDHQELQTKQASNKWRILSFEFLAPKAAEFGQTSEQPNSMTLRFLGDSMYMYMYYRVLVPGTVHVLENL